MYQIFVCLSLYVTDTFSESRIRDVVPWKIRFMIDVYVLSTEGFDRFHMFIVHVGWVSDRITEQTPELEYDSLGCERLNIFKNNEDSIQSFRTPGGGAPRQVPTPPTRESLLR